MKSIILATLCRFVALTALGQATTAVVAAVLRSHGAVCVGATVTVVTRHGAERSAESAAWKNIDPVLQPCTYHSVDAKGFRGIGAEVIVRLELMLK